jgi:hypothetical protein
VHDRKVARVARGKLTIPLDPQWNRCTQQGYEDLKRWVETNERAKREGRDPAKALVEMIRETKKRYLKASSPQT